MTEERDGFVVLVDENGAEVEFEHLDTIEMNDKQYVVLLPASEDEADVDEVVILKVQSDENGDDTLVNVEDEEELNIISKI